MLRFHHPNDRNAQKDSLFEFWFEGGWDMLKRALTIVPVLLLMLSIAFPQGKGGGRGGGSGQGQGQGMGQGQGQGQGTVQGQGMGQGQGGGQQTNAQAVQDRIKTTKQQRDQIRSCDNLADDIQKQSRKMARDSEKKLNHGQLVQQQVHIRNQIRKMEQEHDLLMKGLNANQQQAWQEQIRNMNRLREQMTLHQQQMDGELKGNPDAKRVVERAREMEQTMNEWRKHYGVLSSQAE